MEEKIQHNVMLLKGYVLCVEIALKNKCYNCQEVKHIRQFLLQHCRLDILRFSFCTMTNALT